MVPKSNAILALLMLCAAVAWVGLAGIASAAYPVARAALRGQPVIKDPYHHISGVIAIPPEQMMGEHPTPPWAGPLTPPVFGPNVDASLNNPSNQNETTIAINPENDLVVISAANDYRSGLKPWVYYSTDGGTTWVNYLVPGIASNLNYGDPAMAFGTGNAAYFSYLGYTSICGGQGGMYASRSTDGGATFGAPVLLAPSYSNAGFAVLQDKEYVAVDNVPTSPYFGNAYVGWTQYLFTSGAQCGTVNSQLAAPAIFSRTTDQGISWSVPITASPPISNNNSGVVPAVGLNGEVYLYYVGAAEQSQLFYDSILFSRSTDGGQTFPHFTHISDLVDLPSPLPPTNFRNNPFGAIAADQQLPGFIYAVWADYRTGDADILFSRTTDNGDTWGPPQRVNDDPVSNQKDQFFPWIATSPDGGIHITWFDRREAADNRNYKAYYTRSTDHGLTFEPNVAVSTAPSVPGNSNFIGDYSGIAATDGVVMPSWTDIRVSPNQNDYVARGVFTPQATVTPQPTATSTSEATSTPTSTSPPVVTSTRTSTSIASPTPVCASAWQIVPSPNVGTHQNRLSSVAAVSANDVWAVGYHGNPDPYQTLIMHWNGSEWRVVASPSPGSADNLLDSVVALAPNNVWAVGQYSDGSSGYRTLVEHWDGSAWSVVSSPNPDATNNGLTGIAGVASNDLWAVGVAGSFPNERTLTIHWNGSVWSEVPSPNASTARSLLLELTAVSANDVWAVGYHGDNASPESIRTLALHWDGAVWNLVPTPNAAPVTNVLLQVDAISADEVWAAGYYGNFPDRQTLVQRWDGQEWAIVPSPNVGSSPSILNGITALSSNDIWAVGYYGDYPALQTLTEHWNGQQWVIVPSANLTSNSFLDDIAAVSSSDIWAVGQYGDPTLQTLVERYTAQCPSPTPTLMPSATATACTVSFTDVPTTNTFYANIRCLACRGILGGYADGTFRPNNDITRGQIAKVVSNAAGFNESPGAQIYEDVPASNTFYAWINRLSRRGHMGGYPCGTVPTEPCGTDNRPYFRPNANATRGQLAKIVASAAGVTGTPSGQRYTDVPEDSTFYVWIEQLSALGVMGGYACGRPSEPCDDQNRPYFRPSNNVTRGQASKIVANTFFPGCQTPESKK